MTVALTRTLETDNALLRATTMLATTQGQVNQAYRKMPTMTGLLSSNVDIGAARRNAELPGQFEARQAEEERYRFEAAQLSTALETAPDDEMPAIRDRLYALEDQRKAYLDAGVKAQLDAGRIVSPTALAEKYPMVKFDRPMSEDEARILSDSKRAEMIRDAVVQQGPTGFVSGVQKFGNSLWAMATDPLEVATMFIPVVGQAGKAMAISRLGRVGGRIAVGAIEGGVGNALTEPFYAGMSRSMQLDYDMQDSLMNVGLGFVLGGGIGAVGSIFARGPKTGATARVDAEAPDLAARVDTATPDAPLVLPEAWRARAETMRLADEQRPVADVALRQMATGQSVDVSAIMPRWSMRDAIAELNKEMFSAKKYPLTQILLARGVDPEGPVGGELAHAGITNKMVRGLFRAGGLKNVDALVAAEYEAHIPGISQIVGVAETNGISTGYLDEDRLVQAIISEMYGHDTGIRTRTQIKAEASRLRLEADTLTNAFTEARAAGLHLKTEAEVRFAADLMKRGVAPERLAAEMRPEVALVEHARTDDVDDAAYSRHLDTIPPPEMGEEIADLERMVAALSEADAFELADQMAKGKPKMPSWIDEQLDAMATEQDAYAAYAEAVQAAATCLART